MLVETSHMVVDTWPGCGQAAGNLWKTTEQVWAEWQNDQNLAGNVFWCSGQTSCKRRAELVKLVYPSSLLPFLSLAPSPAHLLSFNLYRSLFVPLLFQPPSHVLSHSSLPSSLSVSPSVNYFSFGRVAVLGLIEVLLERDESLCAAKFSQCLHTQVQAQSGRVKCGACVMSVEFVILTH